MAYKIRQISVLFISVILNSCIFPNQITTNSLSKTLIKQENYILGELPMNILIDSTKSKSISKWICLDGKVLSMESHEPISNALIILYDKEKRDTLSITDSSGSFQIEFIFRKDAILSFEHIAYQNANFDIKDI